MASSRPHWLVTSRAVGNWEPLLGLVVQGRRTGAPRAQRLCLLCDQRAVGDERHMVFECPALQSVRDKYAALFLDGASTMQQFMWQQDVIGVALIVQDCFDLRRFDRNLSYHLISPRRLEQM